MNATRKTATRKSATGKTDTGKMRKLAATAGAFRVKNDGRQAAAGAWTGVLPAAKAAVMSGGGVEAMMAKGVKTAAGAAGLLGGHVIVPDADGRPVAAVLPYADYELLRAAAAAHTENADDAARAADIAGRIDAGAEEVFPAALLDRLDAGDNPIRVFRDHRDLTQKELAAAAGVNQGYLSELETGAKTASVKTLRALARALAVDVDLLMPAEAA